jgi:hypothetical protein
MTPEQITLVVAATCGVLALAAYVGLVLVPAWSSFSRVWERCAAAFLSLYVLLAFIGVGVLAGAAVAWFWDRIQG